MRLRRWFVCVLIVDGASLLIFGMGSTVKPREWLLGDGKQVTQTICWVLGRCVCVFAFELEMGEKDEFQMNDAQQHAKWSRQHSVSAFFFHLNVRSTIDDNFYRSIFLWSATRVISTIFHCENGQMGNFPFIPIIDHQRFVIDAMMEWLTIMDKWICIWMLICV